MINTKTVHDRRSLRFNSLADILRDAERCGPHARTTGNWSPAQIVEHVRMYMTASRSGFNFKAPLPLRLFAPLLRDKALHGTMPAGLKFYGKLKQFDPDPDTSWEHAIAGLRSEIDHINSSEQFDHPSPVLGNLSHDQWVQLHCRHAELHFSFMHPADHNQSNNTQGAAS